MLMKGYLSYTCNPLSMSLNYWKKMSQSQTYYTIRGQPHRNQIKMKPHYIFPSKILRNVRGIFPVRTNPDYITKSTHHQRVSRLHSLPSLRRQRRRLHHHLPHQGRTQVRRGPRPAELHPHDSRSRAI